MDEEDKTELTFQKFDDDEKNEIEEEDGEEDHTEEPEQVTTSSKFWKIEFYQPYFNIDTDLFLKKVVCTLFPFKKTLFEYSEDLWGPCWIVITLVVILCVCNNVGGLVNRRSLLHNLGYKNGSQQNPFNPGTIQEWANDFTVFSVGSGFMFVYIPVIPVLLWLVYKWKKIDIGLVQSSSVYAYSFLFVIPISLICVINFEFLRWSLLIIGFLVCSVSVIINSWKKWKEVNLVFKLGFSLFICVSHIVLSIFVKILFFQWNYIVKVKQ